MLLKCQEFKVNSYVCTSSHGFRDIEVSNCLPSNSRTRSLGVNFAMVSLVGKSIKVIVNFCASSHRFIDINIKNCWPSKSRSRSWNAIFAITPFDGKCQNLQKTPTHFCARYCRFRYINILTFKMLIKVTEAQFLKCHHLMANVKIYTRLPHIIPLALTVSEIYKFKFFNLHKVGQDHRIQFLQSHLSMANVIIYKCQISLILVNSLRCLSLKLFAAMRHQ